MTAQTSPAGLRRSLDGSYRQMFIGGQWVDAVSGETFETRNPATGALLATVPASGKADIDRAVAAARAAFEGPWRKFKPYERQGLLLKIAELSRRIGTSSASPTRSTWACRSPAHAPTATA